MRKLLPLILVVIVFAAILPNIKTQTVEINPTPHATPSYSENIKVTYPKPGQLVSPSTAIKGEARVFENSFAYRVLDSNGKKLLEGHAMADAPDVGQFGPFDVTIEFSTPSSGTGTIEVFEYSAKDGSEINKVVVPVVFEYE